MRALSRPDGLNSKSSSVLDSGRQRVKINQMVLVFLGVSAGARGARAILSHSDQPHQAPIDCCAVRRRPGGGVGEPAATAIVAMRAAASDRGELITAVAVTYRSDVQAEEIRASVDTSGGTPTHLVREPTAQRRYLRFAGRLPKCGTIILYDLGSSGLTLTLADCVSGAVIRTRRSTVLGVDEHDAQLQRRLPMAASMSICR